MSEVEGPPGEGAVAMIEGTEGGAGGGVGEIEGSTVAFLVCRVDLDDLATGSSSCTGAGCFEGPLLVDLLLALGVVSSTALVRLSRDDRRGVGAGGGEEEGSLDGSLGAKDPIWALKVWLAVSLLAPDGIGDGRYSANSQQSSVAADCKLTLTLQPTMFPDFPCLSVSYPSPAVWADHDRYSQVAKSFFIFPLSGTLTSSSSRKRNINASSKCPGGLAEKRWNVAFSSISKRSLTHCF